MRKEENRNYYDDRSDFGLEEDFDNNYFYSHSHQNLTKSQKISVGVLAFFAFFLIFFQFIKFKNNLSEPLKYNTDIQEKKESCSGPNCPQTIADLKAQDTDGDGLNDYDELNIYKTSPYLEDSDSDGFNDFEEIKNDKDPNCPSGRDCYETDPLANAQAEDKNNIDLEELQKTFKQNENSNLEGVNMGSSNLDLKDLENIDANSLRTLLLESGVDKEILNQISDEDLLDSFQEVLKSK